jgi:hypothetical protein
LPGPGPTTNTHCSAAAPSKTAPAASTNSGSFGRSLRVTAAGAGVAGLPTHPNAESDLPESETHANARFALRCGSLATSAPAPTLLAASHCGRPLLQNRHQTRGEMWCSRPSFFAGLASVIVAFEGTVMRILVVAAVIAASCALSGCFHFHTSQVVTAPQPLPPLK